MNTKPPYPGLENLDSIEFLIRLLLFHFGLPTPKSPYSFMGKLSKQSYFHLSFFSASWFSLTKTDHGTKIQ